MHGILEIRRQLRHARHDLLALQKIECRERRGAGDGMRRIRAPLALVTMRSFILKLRFAVNGIHIQ